MLNLLTTAEACGADVIATECPTCHTGLEMHQVRAEKVLGRKTTVKILYFTQLLGMALGLSARRVGRAGEFLRLLRLAAREGAGLMTDRGDAPPATRSSRISTASSPPPIAARPLRRRIADELLALGEAILERWIAAHGEMPTTARSEGFRLLALHRQGAQGDPSFNACRETCRELVYHHNLVRLDPAHADVARRLRLGAMVARHLALFIGGKLEVAGWASFAAPRVRCARTRPTKRVHSTFP